MVVYVDDADPVDVEQLTLDEARMVLGRAEAELPRAYNSAHAQSLRREIAEVADQIEWLESEAREAALEDAAVEHAIDLRADRDHPGLSAAARGERNAAIDTTTAAGVHVTARPRLRHANQ